MDGTVLNAMGMAVCYTTHGRGGLRATVGYTVLWDANGVITAVQPPPSPSWTDHELREGGVQLDETPKVGDQATEEMKAWRA